MSKRTSGITLVEMLVVMAILVISLGVLGAIFVSGLRAYRTEQERATLLQDAQATSQLLQYELSLAGYRGVENSTTVNARNFGGSPIINVSLSGVASMPDQITVRYYEDRYTETTSTLKTVTYSVNAQNATLRRQENSGPLEQVATGVQNMKVRSYLKKDGTSTQCATSTCSFTDAVALTIRLTLTDSHTQDVSVAFSTPRS